eukprot:TRINITY_DN4161_c0_g3_i1.p2 TRINITY_DN4161_c0_g3~~TRINITY_DN4161_c0_g3_i1.p2  ORF type:complete len:148 (-),score=24.43 TRINITY_DN4161_c0_g3_i1:34-477(-)
MRSATKTTPSSLSLFARSTGAISTEANKSRQIQGKDLCKGVQLTGLEEQNGDLAEIKVDKVFALVSDVRAEVATDDAMPCWVVFFVKLLFDVAGDFDFVVLFALVALDRTARKLHGILLHIVGHVNDLEDGFALRHGGLCGDRALIR